MQLRYSTLIEVCGDVFHQNQTLGIQMRLSQEEEGSSASSPLSSLELHNCVSTIALQLTIVFIVDELIIDFG